MNENKNAVLSVTCPSIRGVTADIVSYLASKGCNIRDSAQFDDESTDRYFMRITFRSEEGRSLAELEKEFEPVASKYSMQCRFFEEQSRLRVVLMVSRFGHCLNDLLFRWKIGALPIDIVGVISNHTDFQALVESHAIPYHHIPVTKENKPDAEAAQMRVVRDTQAELIVLARYMQVLSDEMCQQMSGRIINIHHSFLPSFKG
ncbi:formyltetrahydrofolate deformylase, partial [Klebsiella pneumoniae]